MSWPSAPGCVPVSTVCNWIGISRTTHNYWVSKGLLLPASGTGLDDGNAVELAILARLVEKLGLSTANIVWQRLRPMLASWSSPDLFVVFDHDRTTVEVFTHASKAKKASFIPERTFTIFSFGGVADHVRELVREQLALNARRGSVAAIRDESRAG